MFSTERGRPLRGAVLLRLADGRPLTNAEPFTPLRPCGNEYSDDARRDSSGDI